LHQSASSTIGIAISSPHPQAGDVRQTDQRVAAWKGSAASLLERERLLHAAIATRAAQADEKR
jgi:hypothetical protein